MREMPGIENVTRKIEGTEIVYEYLEHLNKDITNSSFAVELKCRYIKDQLKLEYKNDALNHRIIFIF